MALQQIRPDFSGSAESMGQAQRSIGQVGQYANEWMDRLAKEKAVATEQARYDTEQKRQAILDARATTLYDQTQKERSDLIAMKTAVGQGLLDVPQDALPIAQPPQAIAQGLQVSPQEAYMNQGRNVVVPGTTGRNVTTQSPGVYTNANPEIAYNITKMVPGVQSKVAQSSASGLETDYNKSAFTAPYRAVQGLISGAGDALKKSWDTVNAPFKDRMEVLKPNLQELVNPTGSTKVLGMTGKDSTGSTTPTPMVSKTVGMKTTLNDIDMTTLYNTKGKPVGIKDAGDGSNTYYKNKDGYRVNAADVAKGAITKENSYVEGKSEKTYIPGTQGYTKYISGTSNKEFIGNNGTTIPVKAVVGSVQSTITSYQDAVDKMGKGTTADKITSLSNTITKDVLKAHPELAYMAIEIQEMAKKGVGLKLPDGSLTKTEEMKLVAAGEDLKHQYDVQKEGRGYDQAWKLQQSSQGFQAGQNALTRAATKENSLREIAEKAAKVEPVTMSKMDTKGNIISMDVRTNSQLKQAEALGFSLGKTTLGHATTGKGGGATATADNKLLRETFGGSNIGGTSGNALVSLTDAFYSKHKNIPRTMIANKIAEIAGDNTFTDSVSTTELESAFKDYIK